MSRRSKTPPLPDCPLRGLSEASQAEIFALLQPGPDQLNLPDVRGHLAAKFNLEVSESAIAGFKNWYGLRERYRLAEESRRHAIEERRLTHPKETEEQLFEFGQQIFATEALEAGDFKAWAVIQRLRQKDVDQRFTARRLAVLECKAEQADATQAVIEEPLTEEEKMAHIRSIFGLA